MRSMSLSFSSCASAAALALMASTAFAHIDLLNPVSRYVVNRPAGGGSKSCPCGGPANVIDPNRVCDVPAEQSHDTNRSTKVTPFEAGSKITISLAEYIDHSGRFRVAFDPDGADMTDFNANILLDVPDDATRRGSATTPPYTFEITLPMMTCENCTLQVIQDMNGNTTTPVRDPSGDSTYYTCADIRLVAPGTMDEDDDGADDPMTDPPPAPDNGNTGTNTMGMNGGMGNGNGNMGTNLGTVPMMGDSTPATTPAMTGTGTTPSPSMGVGSLMPAMGMSNPSTDAPIMAGTPNSNESGGCSLISLGARTPQSPFAALAVAGMFAAFSARRRQRRAK
ncbi:MAG: SCE4755 family polysaccharide monooxygenase-like protein [Deltaproteobacteria bacterium]